MDILQQELGTSPEFTPVFDDNRMPAEQKKPSMEEAVQAYSLLRKQKNFLDGMEDGDEKDERKLKYEAIRNKFYDRYSHLNSEKIRNLWHEQRPVDEKLLEFAESIPTHLKHASIAGNPLQIPETQFPEQYKESMRHMGDAAIVPKVVTGGVEAYGLNALGKGLSAATTANPAIVNTLVDTIYGGAIGYLYGGKEGAESGARATAILSGVLSTLGFVGKSLAGRKIKQWVGVGDEKLERGRKLIERSGKKIDDLENGHTKFTTNRTGTRPTTEQIIEGVAEQTEDEVGKSVNNYLDKSLGADLDEIKLSENELGKTIAPVNKKGGSEKMPFLEWLREQKEAITQKYGAYDKNVLGKIKSKKEELAKLQGELDFNMEESAKEIVGIEMALENESYLDKIFWKYKKQMPHNTKKGKETREWLEEYLPTLKKKSQSEMVPTQVKIDKLKEEIAGLDNVKYVPRSGVDGDIFRTVRESIARLDDGTDITVGDLVQFREDINRFISSNADKINSQDIFKLKKYTNNVYYSVLAQLKGLGDDVAARYMRFAEAKGLYNSLKKSKNKMQFLESNVMNNPYNIRLLKEFSDPNVFKEHMAEIARQKKLGHSGSDLVREFNDSMSRRYDPKRHYVFDGDALDVLEIHKLATQMSKNIESGPSLLPKGVETSMYVSSGVGLGTSLATGNAAAAKYSIMPILTALGFRAGTKALKTTARSRTMLMALSDPKVQSLWSKIVNGTIPTKEGHSMLKKLVRKTLRGALKGGALSAKGSAYASAAKGGASFRPSEEDEAMWRRMYREAESKLQID